MIRNRESWISRFVDWSHERQFVLVNLLIPFAVFLIDAILRNALEINPDDAGADMALLSISLFMSLIIEGLELREPQDIPTKFFLLLLFVLIWLGCLWFLSSRSPLEILFTSMKPLPLRSVVVTVIGLLSMFYAIAFAIELGPNQFEQIK